MTNNLDQLKKAFQGANQDILKHVDINRVLVPLILEPRNIVQISPLVYAVYTRNLPLVRCLLNECHAIPSDSGRNTVGRGI